MSEAANQPRNTFYNNASTPVGSNLSRQRTLSSSSIDPYEDPVVGLERVTQTQVRRRPRRTENPEASDARREFEEDHALSSKFESLNYEICENQLYRDAEFKSGHQLHLRRIQLNRWIACFLIGICTALAGIVIDILVHTSADFKFNYVLQTLVDKCDDGVDIAGGGCMWLVQVAWMAYNCSMVFIAACLVIFWSPIAAGSGIPQIKCFLNGIQIPEVVSLKTLLVKVFGVSAAVAGGLCAGKEGPMIHSGGAIGAGISQGKLSKNLDPGFFREFRNDREKRDFVSAGAAAGVASAFGAPIGGVLFAIEEGASFWNQALTWRMFFSAMIASFTLNATLTYYFKQDGLLSWNGLANFGVFENKSYTIWEIPLFLVIGVIGGCTGALFNALNYRISEFSKNEWKNCLQSLRPLYYLCICTNDDTTSSSPFESRSRPISISQPRMNYIRRTDGEVINLIYDRPDMLHKQFALGEIPVLTVLRGRARNEPAEVFYHLDDEEKTTRIRAEFGNSVTFHQTSVRDGPSQELRWRHGIATPLSTPECSTYAAQLQVQEETRSGRELEAAQKAETHPADPYTKSTGSSGDAAVSPMRGNQVISNVSAERFVSNKWQRLVEALLVAAVSAFTGFVTLFVVDDCVPLGLGMNRTEGLNRLYCKKGEYSVVANLFFANPEDSVKSLLHSPIGSFKPTTLLIFAIEYFVLSVWTFGLAVPSGVFIPALLTGAAWGRLFGLGVEWLFPNVAGIDPGKYALMGAAAQLGGVVRMTISLTAILLEATKDMTFGLPIMLVLMIAKWVGDFFSEGLYDLCIELSEVPLLGWNAPKMARNITASTVMRSDLVAMEKRVRVGRVVEILSATSHHAFPLVDRIDESDVSRLPDYGRLEGYILRTQLVALVKKRAFVQEGEEELVGSMITEEDFFDVEDEKVEVDEADEMAWIDLAPYMHPHPHRVPLNASLPFIYRLFRGLGLRYLMVVNEDNRLRGIITRKDVARFRNTKGFALRELFIADHQF